MTRQAGHSRLWAILLSAFSVLSPLTAYALDFGYTYSTNADGSKHVDRLVINGTIQRGDYSKLLSFIRRDPKAFYVGTTHIDISSPGGDLPETLKIVEIFKGMHATFILQKPCVSACFFIFLSGAIHVAEPGVLGIHRPYFDPGIDAKLTPTQAKEQQNRLLAQSRKFLEENNVPQYLIETMFSKSSTEVYWLNQQDLDRLGEKPAWYEELLIARCNWDKRAEKENLYLIDRPETDLNRIQFVAELKRVADCSGKIIFDESYDFLKRLLAGAK